MKIATGCMLSLFCCLNYAASIKIAVYSTTNNASLGSVELVDTDYGLLIKPQLENLTAGLHGMHFHAHANCGHQGMDAGAHYDPDAFNSHKGPYHQGHAGDLPLLYVDANGIASTPVLAPRLKTADLTGLALIIHEKGDNYSDNPPLGGGGDRVACGLVSKE